MNITAFLDSTYLKTPAQAGISEEETLKKVYELTDEAIENNFFEVMIRPDYVKEIKNYLTLKKSGVKVGTVIGFHEGTASTAEKLAEAEKAIVDGVDELDYVINYEAYKAGKSDLVKDEFVAGTKLALENAKVVKWIIEIAALTDEQIVSITKDIRQWAEENFDEDQLPNIFVKSSTGFYPTENGKPNGATFEGIELMIQNAGKLPVKAAGGVKSPEDAQKMIEMGVKRIGTSSALSLISNKEITGGY
ncbi:deoxyribose-phosphate aldolase [Chryseobacterium sp. 6424]|uniref:deoxyribose-phosphate aldolase n=1 Tax=Chryseobacterium sp. 6424 TaxID=2039166 RepID=UPI000EFCE77E|nr:deoxyribose-phosphate aldolase [Chryseobacterium sp. 6424]AYO57121.1 deoxyribose-phosphate aldolase [Chryseobacterium sp. 6424]